MQSEKPYRCLRSGGGGRAGRLGSRGGIGQWGGSGAGGCSQLAGGGAAAREALRSSCSCYWMDSAWGGGSRELTA